MKKGEPMAIIPGGFSEATISSSKANRVFLRNRIGFVKYALEYGYALTPCYIFHENELYFNIQGAWRFRHWLNSFGIPAVLPFGRWWCLFLPRNDRLNIVIGKVLTFPRINNPTREQVAEYHQRYVTELVELFDRHKAAHGQAQCTLEIW